MPRREAEGVELHALDSPAPTAASISYQLAHETARELEESGEFAHASEVLAVALAEEALRINQHELGKLDLRENAQEFRDITVAMAQQQRHAAQLRVPNRQPSQQLDFIHQCFATLRIRRPVPEVSSLYMIEHRTSSSIGSKSSQRRRTLHIC